MKKHWSTIILIVILFIGLSLLLYPTVSDYWNSFRQSRVISNYLEKVAEIDDAEYNRIWDSAVEYNKKLAKRGNVWDLSDKALAEYNSQLDILGNGIMGYIDIPVIDCSLPIYHGTSEPVLQVAIGHVEGSSLPVGGSGSHCVLSGHRGLPSARLFTDLDKMVVGDIFTLRTLDTVMTYEVDRILIVLPHELDPLKIIRGKDLCTLVTCTPYGVNTHRLLVTAHRIDNIEEETDVRVTADAMQIETTIIAPIIAVPILLLLLMWILVNTRSRKKRRRKPNV